MHLPLLLYVIFSKNDSQPSATLTLFRDCGCKITTFKLYQPNFSATFFVKKFSTNRQITDKQAKKEYLKRMYNSITEILMGVYYFKDITQRQ